MQKTLWILPILVCFSTFAQNRGPASEPTGWLWGVGIAASQDVYADFDNRIIPLPLIGYRGERLSVFGPFVSYKVYENNGFTFSAELVPVFAGYEEDDSDVLTGMDDRDFSLALGAKVDYSAGAWTFSLASNYDVLDTYDGNQTSFSISRRFLARPFMIEPSISINYQDSNYVDYYYGVTAEEAIVGRPEYIADSATNLEVGLAFSTRAFFGGMTRLQVSSTFYDDSIADSPITDDDSELGARLIFTRFF